MRKTIVLSIVLIIGSVVSGCDSEKNDLNKYLLLLLKPIFSGEAVWARSISAGINDSYFSSIAAGSDGCSYAAGEINGSAFFIFGNQSVAGPIGGNSSNAVLVKYDRDGNAVWARSATSGSDYSTFNAIAVGNDGCIYVAGSMGGNEAFTFGAQSVTGGGPSVNALLVKYDRDGNALWARSVSAGRMYSGFSSVAVSNDGIYAAGNLQGPGTYTFGAHSVACPNSFDNPVLVRYDREGNALWAKTITSGAYHSKYKAVSAGDDGVYAAGYITGRRTYWFGHQSVVGANSSYNAVLVKYDAAGTEMWARSVTGGANESMFYSVSAGGDGMYAAGYITSSGLYSFGAASISGIYSGKNAVLVKYDKEGNAQWARSVTAGANESQFESVSVWGDGVYAAGHITSSGLYSFGPGSVSGANNSGNIVLVRYDADGQALWTRSVLTASRGSYYNSVAASGEGIFAAGSIGEGAYTFGVPSVAGIFTGANAVIVKYK